MYVFDKPILYSELVEKYGSRNEISNYILNRINELGDITKEAQKNEKEA